MTWYVLRYFSSIFCDLGEGDINEVLIKTLAEAHANTNLKLDIVHEMLRKGVVRSTKKNISLKPALNLFNDYVCFL